jgi:hypothetical protein
MKSALSPSVDTTTANILKSALRPVPLAMAALLCSLNVSAAPVYLLLEGTITHNIEDTGCAPNCVSSPYTGKTIKIEATWDDRKIFGSNASAVAGTGHFQSTGYVGEAWQSFWVNPDTWERIPHSEPRPAGWIDIDLPVYGTSYYPLAGPSLWDAASSWQYTITIDGVVRDLVSMDRRTSGQDGDPSWLVDLQTQRTASGDSVSLAFSTSGEREKRDEFNFALTAANLGVLDAQLFGFNWNSSQGGTGTGGTSSHWGRAITGSSTNEISFTRAILTYDADDLAAVPLPASAWMFGSAALGLVGTHAAKRRKTPASA